MARLCLFLMVALALVVVQTSGRIVPTEASQNEKNMHIEADPNEKNNVPTGSGLKDQKNFITYGGIGSFAGVGGAAGIVGLPSMGGIGGPGLGGTGGLGGAVPAVGLGGTGSPPAAGSGGGALPLP